MKPLKYEEVRRLLPAVDELRPVFDLLLEGSYPDPGSTWSGSAELETEGARLVDPEALARHAEALADQMRDDLLTVYTAVGDAVKAMAHGDGSEAADAFLAAAAHEERQARPARARAYAKGAHQVARQAGDGPRTSRALRRWARAARAEGDLWEAGARYAEAYAVALAHGDVRGAAEAALGAGNVFEQHGQWADARSQYDKALAVLENHPEDAPERWQAQVNIHIVLRSRGALEESLPWLVQAEEAAAAIGDAGASLFFENAWGQLHLWQHEFERAEERFRNGLARATHPAARVTIRLNLAEALLAQGRNLDATEQGREAEREALKARVWAKLAEVYRLLGRCAASRGNPDAFVLFEHSLEMCRERNLPVIEQALTLQAYSEAERARGDEEAADSLLEQAVGLYAALGISELRHPWVDVYGEPTGQHRKAEADGPGETNSETNDGQR